MHLKYKEAKKHFNQNYVRHTVKEGFVCYFGVTFTEEIPEQTTEMQFFECYKSCFSVTEFRFFKYKKAFPSRERLLSLIPKNQIIDYFSRYSWRFFQSSLRDLCLPHYARA